MTEQEIKQLNSVLAPGIRVEEHTPYCLVFRHLYQDKLLFTLFNDDFSELKVGTSD